MPVNFCCTSPQVDLFMLENYLTFNIPEWLRVTKNIQKWSFAIFCIGCIFAQKPELKGHQDRLSFKSFKDK